MKAERTPHGEVVPGDTADEHPWPNAGSRREAQLRHQLTAAIYFRRVDEAVRRQQQLAFLLGARAAGDFDLEIARQWLDEHAEAVETWRESVRLSRVKLLLTTLPLAFASLLTILLAAVLIWG